MPIPLQAVRFDLSWAKLDWCRSTLANLRQAEANTDTICAVILETSGPELEVMNVKPSTNIVFKAGSAVTVTGDAGEPFSATHVSLNYKANLADTDLCLGAHICIDRCADFLGTVYWDCYWDFYWDNNWDCC